MENHVQKGHTLKLTAPYTRTSGQGALVGSIFGVAVSDVTSAAEGEFAVEGVFTLAKTSAQAWSQGDPIYWDNSNKRCDTTASVGKLIGVATAAAANPSSTGDVRLVGLGVAQQIVQQSALADLTDNGGGAAADGTIGAVTAPTALTDNGGGTADGTVASQAAPAPVTDSSGYSGTHSDTVASTAAITTITDNSGLDGTHDNTVAATAAIVDLTDSSGYSGTHGDTVAATGAITTLTDDTGKSGGHNDTLEVVADWTPSVAWDGATVHPSAADATALGAKLTALAQNESDLAQKIIEIVTRDAVHAQNVSNVTQKVKELVARDQVHGQNVSDLAQKIIELVARDAVHAQNVSNLAQKIIEIVTLEGTAQNNLKELTTAQAANRTAIVALTDAVKELSAKQNALLAKLRTAGVLAT